MAEGFTFDGRPVPARPGQSVAAALTEAGVRAFRRTAKGAERGLFCGMGVCQDCLVAVDGQPNRRACMTAAAPGLRVETQGALARLDAAAPAIRRLARRLRPDVLVLGAGVGGLSAAAAAARAGASVLVLDERSLAGGQYYKQAAGGAPPLDAQQAEGAALVAEARAAGAELLGGAEVWGAFDGEGEAPGLLVLAERDGEALAVRPRAAIVATGAYERPRMVPGWTLPGVMTTGAAQTLWRSYRTLPGRRVAVAGSGPLNLQVALELAEGGADVAFVAEGAPAPWGRPWRALRLAAVGPRLAATGVALALALRRRGVPVLHAHDLARIERQGDGLRVTLAGPSGPREAVVDALAMNDGFEPQNEVLRLLGAALRIDPVFGHLRCERDGTFATNVPGLWAVGDCAGLGGAPAARVEGRVAGRAAAAATGHPTPGSEALDAADRREVARHRRFQRALWALHAPAPKPLSDAPDDLVVCRCEEVTLGEVRGALAALPGHAGSVKRTTRLGMGRCQGRYCAGVAARLVAEATGVPVEDRSHFAPRVPIKPVTIAAVQAAEEALGGET